MEPPVVIAKRFQILGSVQGLGYRPELARLAMAMNLKGTIANSARGVEMHLEGLETDLQSFTNECIKVCPKNGKIEKVTVEDTVFLNFTRVILDSSEEMLPLRTYVPLDRIFCDACSLEISDFRNSRHNYLLNACSDCGPRYTIIKSMPFERSRTSLQPFSICEQCDEEYARAENRRFHSQGNACSNCGPQLMNTDNAVDHLLRGNVIALKGVGGYQLLAIASNERAIRKLRALKKRFDKPFAVMVANIEEAKNIGVLSTIDELLLTSVAGPIVIVEQLGLLPNSNSSATHSLSTTIDSLTSGLNSIGLMLPTTPLHSWLAVRAGPLVVTSANIEGDPIITSDVEMLESMMIRADQIITHNREIVRHADDSVIRVIANRGVTIRLGRGLGPHVLPRLELDSFEQDNGAVILALGGHQKVAVSFSNGYQSILGPHLGDMDSLKSRERLAQHVRDLLKLYGGQPTLIVHDLHPDFFTTRWAKEQAKEIGADTFGVQHHHAHLASGVLDAKWWDRSFIGIAWDGTGYGDDGVIWGGEAFQGKIDKLERQVSLYPFRLPGGEQAIYEPYRIAESLLWESYRDSIPIPPLEGNRSSLHKLLANGAYSPQTSSMGRLFDGVAALIIGTNSKLPSSRISYEGHWAMLLESMARHASSVSRDVCRYKMPLVKINPDSIQSWSPQPRYRWDWRPMIRSIVDDLHRGESPQSISVHFHRALALAISDLGVRNREQPLLLTGGVFQNKVLVELTSQACDENNLEWQIPTQIPINDGGLSAGQLLLGYIHHRNRSCV